MTKKISEPNPEYISVSLSKEEILKVLYLLYGEEASLQELKEWADIIGGLPKHLVEKLEGKEHSWEKW